MRRTEVALSDNLFQAAVEQARKEERHSGNTNGVPSLIRRALHYYLNKNGWPAAFLRGTVSMSEMDAARACEGDPRTRMGNNNGGQ